MRSSNSWLRSLIVGALGIILGLAGAGYGQRQLAREETLTQRLARLAKLKESDADAFFTALGPAIREELERGKEVAITGLGTFRVVRIAEHKDLRNGQPVIVPAVNMVEFLAAGEINGGANSDNAQPAETVPPFQYIPLPGQTPGQKAPRTRTPSIRTR